ncbi:unnamed protein product [Sphagnum troendelagicum]|uniref:Protein SPT2 homolog n=1 Tax=Sphagnum troendelagicum TaxID=128251 RepID=A0ABP0U110_9BRYO
MWREDRTEYLRSNRDYSCLFDGDEAAQEQSRRKSNLSSTGGRRGEESSKFSNDVKHERQEYLDRRQRLKELERQKLKGKLGSRPHNHHDGAHEETVHHSAQDREKRPQPHSKNRSFGSFFGPSEPIVAKRIIDEAAAREGDENASKKASASSSRLSSKLSSAGAHKSGDRHIPNSAKPVNEAMLKVKRLKEARDYSFLMSDAPDELPMKKPSTPSKPVESRRDHPKQATSDYRTLDRVQLSRDARPSSKTSKHVSTSVSKVTSSSSRPSQQSQARQSLNLQKERPKPDPRLKSSVSSKPSVQKNTSGKSREAPVQDRFKRPEPSRIPSKLPQNKVTSGSAQQKSVERRFIVQAKQSKVPVKATPTTMNKMKRPDAQQRWQAEDEEESSDSFISDEDEADTRGYSGVSSMIREMFRYNPNKYCDIDDEDDRNMEVGFNKIQAEERRSAKIAREEDEREQELIEAEERAERARKAKKRKLG